MTHQPKLIAAIAAINALADITAPDTPSVADIDRIEKEVSKAGRAFGELVTAIAEMAGGKEDAKYTTADLAEELVSEALYRARCRAQDREWDAPVSDPNAEHRLTGSQLGVGRYA